MTKGKDGERTANSKGKKIRIYIWTMSYQLCQRLTQ